MTYNQAHDPVPQARPTQAAPQGYRWQQTGYGWSLASNMPGTPGYVPPAAAPGAAQPGGLSGAYQGAFDEAKKANEERYKEILSGYNNRYSEAMKTLEGMGAQEKKDIGEQYKNLYGGQYQNLVDRGLAGTQAAPALGMGVQRQQTDALARLNERLRTQQVGYQTALSGDTLQFQERRNDTYPDMQQFINLSQAYGAGGMGRAGSGMGSTGGAYGNSLRLGPGQPDGYSDRRMNLINMGSGLYSRNPAAQQQEPQIGETFTGTPEEIIKYWGQKGLNVQPPQPIAGSRSVAARRAAPRRPGLVQPMYGRRTR